MHHFGLVVKHTMHYQHHGLPNSKRHDMQDLASPLMMVAHIRLVGEKNTDGQSFILLTNTLRFSKWPYEPCGLSPLVALLGAKQIMLIMLAGIRVHVTLSVSE